MKRVLSLLAVCATLHGFTAAPAVADPEIKNWKTAHSMGCMLLQECTDDVEEVFSLLDVSHEYDNWEDFTPVANEFNNMLLSLNQVGVKVFLADEKYFPEGHRGVYHTVSNNFFLNRKFMDSPATLMMVMRHEGWHAAQDCMAGTIDNSLIAIIKPEDEVPMLWRVLAERTYPKSAVPWEAEAGWAGRTENMTMKALAACANGNMWEVYEPTPLTREYLEKEGFIK
tara:strand:+ start:6057 stop:6734 length:678 start_codon:yes stop_codon:yes gene_type:complete